MRQILDSRILCRVEALQRQTVMERPEPDRLLADAQAGDARALEQLLRLHRKAVFRYGLRVCQSTEDAEDAVQETLWAATRAIGGFRGAAAVTTWLFAI